MARLARDNWWPATAALLAGAELFVAVGIWVDRLIAETTELYDGAAGPSDYGPLYGDILLTGAIALGALAVVNGLYVRARRPDQGHRLVLAGLAPAALAGVVFFWFPAFWVVSVIAIATMAGVGRDLRTIGEPVQA